jgi:hypothetical protein
MTPNFSIFLLCLIGSHVITIWALVKCWRKSLKDARTEGWCQGFKDAKELADAWWKTAETEVDLTRQQIWREEPKTGAGWP